LAILANKSQKHLKINHMGCCFPENGLSFNSHTPEQGRSTVAYQRWRHRKVDIYL